MSNKIINTLEKIKDVMHPNIKSNIWSDKYNPEIKDYQEVLVTKENGFFKDYTEYLKIKFGIDVTDDIEKLKEDIIMATKLLTYKDKGYILDGERKNVVQLANEKYMLFHKDKYESQLNIILNDLDTPLSKLFKKDAGLNAQLNLDYTGDMTFLRGKFFLSKKGTPTFDTTGAHEHVLVRVEWGGAFNKSTGIVKSNLPKNIVYEKYRTSNGGRMGVDYIVLPLQYRKTYTVDDF